MSAERNTDELFSLSYGDNVESATKTAMSSSIMVFRRYVGQVTVP